MAQGPRMTLQTQLVLRAMLAEPTSIQRQAFELIGAPIPLTLK